MVNDLMETTAPNLPSGSPIIGYGEASRKISGRFVGAIIGLLLVASLVGGLCYALFFATIHLPDQTIAYAVISGGTELPKEMPRVWREAALHTTNPIVLGLAQTSSTITPYVISPRINQTFGVFSRKENIFQIESDAELSTSNIITKSASLSWDILRSVGAQAYIHVFPSELFGETLPSFSGRLSKNHFRISDVDLQNESLENATISASINDANWPVVQAILETTSFGLALDERPSSFSWNSSSGTEMLRLTYKDQVPESVRRTVFQYVGTTSSTSFKLPDGTIAEELEIPQNSTLNSIRAEITTTSVRFGENPTDVTPSQAIFIANRDGIQRILNHFHLPDFGISQIIITEKNGNGDILFR